MKTNFKIGSDLGDENLNCSERHNLFAFIYFLYVAVQIISSRFPYIIVEGLSYTVSCNSPFCWTLISYIQI